MHPTPSERGARVLRTALAAFALWGAGAAQALTVFTCEPEWAALVRQLAPSADVRSATHARQDPHHIEARPSLIAQLRKADLAVCTGAALEAGWLPMLQQRAGNPKVQDGAPGMVYAADHVKLIDPRPAGGVFDGDVHAAGNPHVQLDPRRMADMAAAIAQRLEQVDPSGAAGYRSRLAAFQADWQGRIAQWERRAAPLRGTRVVAQHSTFAYLWRWVGMEQVADLEPKPGVPPTPGHLQKVLEQVRSAPPRAVVVSAYQDPRGAQWLAQQLGAGVTVLQLPSTVTEEAPAETLAGLYDHLLDRLLAGR
ncbi:zinc ABC transporter substrate-binding protein [Ramlibacter sp. HM2]|uniref:Zinc ABC transporter substrate-binding protein n=1 Tax=Ramlibacter pallidus TaxID=2780087 RepID=A0ABR9S4Z8_9BURK|nr:zinc ABC transporter substrate-binding protein [Ramlibacter pallidus]